MGEELSLFQPEFNGSIRVEARPEKLTTDAGAVLLREVLERLGITSWLAEKLVDSRRPELVTHPLPELLNTSLLLLGQGWRDQDDADRLRDDAVFRLAVSGRRGISPLETRPAEERAKNHNPSVPDGLASQPTLSRTVRMLSTEENRTTLRQGILEVAARRTKAMRQGHRLRYLTVDIDSLPIEVHGHQPFSRVKNNPVLDRMALPFLNRPVGRPPNEPRTWLYEMMYQAKGWSRPRRVVLVVLEREGELFLHHFWLITSWTTEQMDATALLEMYRQRGAAEGFMGELMSVLQPALSSSPRPKSHYRGEVPENRFPSGDSFEQNEVILLLNLLAYQVVHAARVLLEEATHEGWSLKRFRELVLKIAARVLVHERRAVLVVAQASARLWELLWRRLRLLRVSELRT